jgi:hypothetical protein
MSTSRFWHFQRSTTQDLYRPWPFGSEDREKTTEDRVGEVKRSSVTAVSVFMIRKGMVR